MNNVEEPVFWETIDGDALIERSRSILATKFYEGVRHERADEVADVMVILDDDVQYDPRDLWKIVRAARERQEPVGGVYVTRSRKPHLASRLLKDHPINFGTNELTPVEYLATGFMAIPRKVIQAVAERGLSEGFETGLHGGQRHYLDWCDLGVGEHPIIDFFGTFKIADHQFPGKLHRLSEDWAFCECVRQCGFNIWADSSIILSHRAYVSLTVHDLDTEARHALSEEGAPAQGSSVLIVDGAEAASQRQELTTVSG